MINNPIPLIPKASFNRVLTPPIFTSVEDLDSGWTDWYANGTLSFDSVDFKSGAASIKIVCANAGELCGYHKDITDADWSAKNFKIWVKASNWSQLAEATLLISTNGNFDGGYTCNLINKIVTAINDVWVEVTLTRDDFSTFGAGSNWATVNAMIIRAAGVAGQTPTVHYDQFAAFPEGAAGYVSVVFDDSWATAFTQGKLKMDQYNMKGTIFVIPEAVDTTNYMTTAQLIEAQRQGWDLGSHGNTELTTLSAEALDAELARIKRYMSERGYLGHENFALPGGAYNEAVSDAVLKYFQTCRTIQAFSNPTSYPMSKSLGSMIVLNTTPTATVQGYIDAAATNKKWLILVFHKIVTPASASTEYAVADFGTVIDYLASSSANVLPVSEVLRRL